MVIYLITPAFTCLAFIRGEAFIWELVLIKENIIANNTIYSSFV